MYYVRTYQKRFKSFYFSQIHALKFKSTHVIVLLVFSFCVLNKCLWNNGKPINIFVLLSCPLFCCYIFFLYLFALFSHKHFSPQKNKNLFDRILSIAKRNWKLDTFQGYGQGMIIRTNGTSYCTGESNQGIEKWGFLSKWREIITNFIWKDSSSRYIR